MSSDKTKRRQESKKKNNNMTSTDTKEATARTARIDDDVMATIGRKLRAAYDDVLEEPVPDRFLNLLDELDKKDRERK